MIMYEHMDDLTKKSREREAKKRLAQLEKELSTAKNKVVIYAWLGIAYLIALPWFFSLLWNHALVTSVDWATEINYLQALGLLVLLLIIPSRSSWREKWSRNSEAG